VEITGKEAHWISRTPLGPAPEPEYAAFALVRGRGRI
jgi:hypothetical protein